MTVRELKKILWDVPDDMIIVIPNRSYEENGYMYCHLVDAEMTE